MTTKSSARQRRRSRRRAAIVLVPTVGGVFVAGTAFAFWTTSGTGSGSAATGTSAVVTVAQTSTVTNLVPGGPAKPITFSITNGQPTAQYITSVDIQVASIKVGVTDVDPMLCSPADFDIVQPQALNADLVPGTTPFTNKNASIAMKNAAYNQDGCKNVTIGLSLTTV
jgi:hypothetical protein